MKILLIDSGTTTTRVRLWDQAQVVFQTRRKVGAKDVALHSSNAELKRAIKECMMEILKECQLCKEEIDGIVAAGMISSNMGLVEIPHVKGPVDLSHLIEQLHKQVFPEIIDIPILFVPGVRFESDIMRGEETEIFGYMQEVKNVEETLMMHYGSHHKCILFQNGQITRSATAITGELMMTIAENTILKSSLLPIDEMEIDMEWIHKGLGAAKGDQFGNALFSIRVFDTIQKVPKNELTNYYIGTLVSQDLALIRQMVSDSTKRIVLYGKSLFPQVFQPILKEEYPFIKCEVLSEEEADLLSAKGAIEIYKRAIGGK